MLPKQMKAIPLKSAAFGFIVLLSTGIDAVLMQWINVVM